MDVKMIGVKEKSTLFLLSLFMGVTWTGSLTRLLAVRSSAGRHLCFQAHEDQREIGTNTIRYIYYFYSEANNARATMVAVTLGAGDQTIRPGDRNAEVVLGNGNSILPLGAGRDTITTGKGHDEVRAGNRKNVIRLGRGGHNLVQLGKKALCFTGPRRRGC
jgi:hypothetical protein